MKFYLKGIEYWPQTLVLNPYILTTQCSRPQIFQTMNQKIGICWKDSIPYWYNCSTSYLVELMEKKVDGRNLLNYQKTSEDHTLNSFQEKMERSALKTCNINSRNIQRIQILKTRITMCRLMFKAFTILRFTFSTKILVLTIYSCVSNIVECKGKQIPKISRKLIRK